MGKELIIGHTDGHGVSATAITARFLKHVHKPFEVLCKFPDTGVIPKFWSQTIDKIIEKAEKYERIIILDIPLDAKNIQLSIKKLIELAERTEVIYVDHHQSSAVDFDKPENLVFSVVDSAYKCYWYYMNDGVIPEILKIGAICDRDPKVIDLGVTNRELEIADGLDVLVRKDINEALDLLINAENMGEIEVELLKYANEIPNPTIAAVCGGVVVVKDVPQSWKFKVLDKACRQTRKDYAVTLTENQPDRATGEPKDFVTAIKFWMSDKPSVKALLPDDLQKIAIGHPDAITISVPVGQGRTVLKRVLEALRGE